MISTILRPAGTLTSFLIVRTRGAAYAGQIPDYYKWSWPFLLIAVIGLPLVVYALCYFLIATVVWVRRGFKPA